MLNNLENVKKEAQQRLLTLRGHHGHWEGRLSSSPLAGAVAVVALSQAEDPKFAPAIRSGIQWLAENINDDGGWGDSPESRSNLSTTLLCWSALNMAYKVDLDMRGTEARTEAWITQRVGSLAPKAIARTVLEFYGEDKTFSAPILVLCAIAGRLGHPARWDIVPQLPLELAALPHQLFKWARLPVVSYALPALITIGLARHVHRPGRFPVSRWLRNRLTPRVLSILEAIQPGNGGFLEATPLTSFVAMSMAASGYRDHRVTKRCFEFILNSQREDGSWPIDTSIATWVSTLSVKALLEDEQDECLNQGDINRILRWLLDQQFTCEHPFTHAAPGGWSWIDAPGAVPDADDSSGALLALYLLDKESGEALKAASHGVTWLLNLQNADGGIPTFCKGWGRLPFDRSCPDLTAHALRAWAVWEAKLEPALRARVSKAIARGIVYMKGCQRQDGSWLPLWFGNQWSRGEENPVYGTTQVLLALQHPLLKERPGVAPLLEKGTRWLVSAQNDDQGWGSTRGMVSTIEETGLAVSVLAESDYIKTMKSGVQWLIDQTHGQKTLPAAPIGLYFASLWYDEKLYPVIFTAQALARASKKMKPAFTL